MKFFSRIRSQLSDGLRRLRDNYWAVVQTAVAASVAYLLTSLFLGSEQAFYAPIAAVVCLSLTLGQPKRRALLITVGVTVGLTVANLIVLAIGVGPVQIGIVIALAMVAAVLFSGSTLLINQAAISSILVIVLQPPQQTGFSPDRLLDALVGGGVALAINYLFPVDPERMVERAARPIFTELSSTLEEVAAAMRDGDLDRGERALSQARGIDEQVNGFRNTLTAGQETARFAPLRRGELGHLQVYADAADRIDLTVRGARSVARAAVGVVRYGSFASDQLSEAMLDLCHAVRALDDYLMEPGNPEDVRQFALEAAKKATASLKAHGGDIDTGMLVGQIRTMAMDLLMSTGMDQTQAIQTLEETAGPASEIWCGSIENNPR